MPTLPGDLGFVERPATEGESTVINAFDQYVPGFGITFLLIGMMLGIALTLFDERDWGTLRRMRVSGAPLTGLLLGKLIARFIVGIVQMVLAVRGRIGCCSESRSGAIPLALLIPTVGISFASAALGLVIASIARAHDSVMPFGVTLSMAIAAIGGCWWPLDFEPGWMRMLARFAPTTWTHAVLQRFDDPQSAAVGDALALRRHHGSRSVVPALRPHPLHHTGRLALAVCGKAVCDPDDIESKSALSRLL